METRSRRRIYSNASTTHTEPGYSKCVHSSFENSDARENVFRGFSLQAVKREGLVTKAGGVLNYVLPVRRVTRDTMLLEVGKGWV